MKATTRSLSILIILSARFAAAAIFSDGFTGQSPFWRKLETSGASAFLTGDGKLDAVTPGNAPGAAGFVSNCTLSGDFDVNVDYELVTPPVAGWNMTISALNPATLAILGLVSRAGTVAILVPGPTPNFINTNAMSGTLRLVRAGGMATAYHNGALIAGPHPWPTQDVRIGILVGQNGTLSQTVEGKFDNFDLQSGTPICPQNLACGDGVTETSLGGEQCDDGNSAAGDTCCGCRSEPLVPVDVAGGWQLNVLCPGAGLVSRPLTLTQTGGSADVTMTFGPTCGTVFGSDNQIRAITDCFLGDRGAQVCGSTFAGPAAGSGFFGDEIAFPSFSSNLGTCTNLARSVTLSRLDGNITADAGNRAVGIAGDLRLDSAQLFNAGETSPCFTTAQAFCTFEMRRNGASPGMNVTVEPLPGVTITFLQVYDETQVVVTVQTAAGGALPANFEVVANGSTGAYLDIQPFGSYASGPGAVTICLSYRDVNPADGIVDGTSVNENDLKILHEEGGTFIDRTSSRDPVNNRICASVGSFSQFVLGAGSAPTLPSLCGATPQTGCRTTTQPGASSLLIKDTSGNDRIIWKWRGAATTKADFGDPLATTDYQLCVYDRTAGTPISVMGTTAPAGGSCGGAQCWGDQSTGFKYHDRDATPDGLFLLQLKEGDAGKAKIGVKGKGALLHAPPLPLAQDPAVTVQLVGSNGNCWEANFSSATKNDTRQFRAKSD